MSMQQAIGGPVSAELETSLRNRVRQQGIVLWLDMKGDYSGFVDRLRAVRVAGKLPYEVCAFRGSYLELMLELESIAGGVDKTQLVVHLPGLNEETIKGTPLLELYRAGVRYRKKLDTLITEAAGGRVRREQIDSHKAQKDISLDGADAWLDALLNDTEGGLSAQLRAMSLTAVVDDLMTGGFVAGKLKNTNDEAVIWERLDAWTGLHDDWRTASIPRGGRPRPDDVAFAVSGWALCVEYVDDLKRAPFSPLLKPAKGLPSAVVAACRKLATHLRDRHRDFYQRSADETESLLVDETEHARAEELGDIDTFRFEENRILEAALQALKDEQWSVASTWADARVSGGSFWLSVDPSRRSAWQLIANAAELGLSIERAGSRIGTSSCLSHVVNRYVSHGVAVDQTHRQLEQRRLALLYPRLPQFDRLRAQLDEMRCYWRRWADAWAQDFNDACTTHGFLPEADLQQRNLFDEVVRPMTTEPGVTAYFVVDALRFEMAEELYRTLKDTPATTISLKPRLAELPSVTAVGMNVLAPVVSQSKLQPSLSKGNIQGFSTGEFRVSNPRTRKRAMHDRVGGGTCPWLSLEKVLSRNVNLKKTVAQAKLLVVHSLEIDSAGQNGSGPAVFEHVMQKLRAAWRLLRDAGVRRFVFTSDHGFLLLDDSSTPALSHGRKIDPKGRHVFSPVAADHTGEVRVPLASLGYEGVEGHLMFPATTAVFDTGKRTMSFVHGGNSLQERVIPVLTLVHRTPTGGSTLSFGVEAKAEEGVGGMHAISGKVTMNAQGALSFGGQREIELGLSVVDVPGVQVELCQTRGGARLLGGAIYATVDADFELVFRLTGNTDARVLVEMNHPSAVSDVTPCVLESRFAVSAGRVAPRRWPCWGANVGFAALPFDLKIMRPRLPSPCASTWRLG